MVVVVCIGVFYPSGDLKSLVVTGRVPVGTPSRDSRASPGVIQSLDEVLGNSVNVLG